MAGTPVADPAAAATGHAQAGSTGGGSTPQTMRAQAGVVYGYPGDECLA
jgi:hypothetical protein